MTKTTTFIVAASLCLAGCVNHQWVPGPEAAGDFTVISARCQLASMGSGGGGFLGASGSPQFVGAVMGAGLIGGAIIGAVQQHRVYELCLQSAGFVPIEPQS